MNTYLSLDANGVSFDLPNVGTMLGHDTLSNGQRINSANALQIAMDMLSYLADKPAHVVPKWTQLDVRLSTEMLGMIRAQQGVISEDSKILTGRDNWHATRQLDVWIFG